MSNLGPIDKLILEKLERKVMHSRSFHRAKGVVAGLVKRGLVKRVAGETASKVYLDITPAGKQALKGSRDVQER